MTAVSCRQKFHKCDIDVLSVIKFGMLHGLFGCNFEFLYTSLEFNFTSLKFCYTIRERAVLVDDSLNTGRQAGSKERTKSATQQKTIRAYARHISEVLP